MIAIHCVNVYVHVTFFPKQPCMNIVFNGLAKLGNVVEANVSEFSRAENMLWRQIFSALKQVQKHICFLDTNFTSETCVSHFSQHENNVD